MTSENQDVTSSEKHIEFRTQVVPAKREMLQGELRDLFIYWNRLRDDAFAPAWDRFSWDHVPDELVRQAAVVEVRRSPLDFVYCYWGDGRKAMQGGDYHGMSVREFKPRQIAEKAIIEYTEVMAQRMALCVRTQLSQDADDDKLEYPFLRLPFSDDGDRVNHILGAGLYDKSAKKKAYDFYGTEDDDRIDLDDLLEQLDGDQ